MLHGPTLRSVTVVVPLTNKDDSGSLPHRVPAVVMLQGGLVSRDRYLWLAKHVATRGVAVALPEHAGWLAILDPDVVASAKSHLQHKLGRKMGGVAVMGHSLGGVVATSAWMKGGYEGLALLASEPLSDDDVGSSTGPVLLVAGGRDESMDVDRVRAAWERFGGAAVLALVDDLTHFAWTDRGLDPVSLRETEEPSPDLASSRRGALFALDAYLAWRLQDDTAGWEALLGNVTPPAGTRLEVRNAP
jgi:alpha-beta hydrolase superfamily lysophospholipase